MSRLTLPATDAAVPELRAGAQIRDLEQRIADLERRYARVRNPEQFAMTGTGDTGTLGSAWQQIPGMSITLTLETGWMVVGDATVLLAAGSGQNQAFFVRNLTPGGPQTAASSNESGRLGPNIAAGARVSVPALLNGVIITTPGNYTFGIFCTAVSGSGGAGIGAGGSSYARLLVYK